MEIGTVGPCSIMCGKAICWKFGCLHVLESKLERERQEKLAQEKGEDK